VRIGGIKKTQVLLHLGLIILVTSVAFYPSLRNGFTNWDDRELLLENETVKGVSASHLRAMFSQSYAGFGGYTPLVLVSYALEYQVFGLNPGIFHVDNLLLHILNTVLIYILIALITRNIWMGFVGALLFGVHPLHVEAVAWIQGRKDLLFSLFFLAASISYLLFLRRKDRRAVFYALSLVFFACSLFSKVTAVAFPLIIFLLESHTLQSLDRRTLRRAAPFFALAAVFLVLAFLTMRHGSYGIPTAKVHLTYLQNLSLFFYAFVFYISKIFVPLRLMARYPADIALYPWGLLLNGAVFGIACAFLYLVYRRNKESVRFGVAFFVMMLMPTLPFHFAGQPYADRYTYLPLAGLLLIIAAFIVEPRPDPRLARRSFLTARAGGLILLVALLGVKTQALTRVWRDSVSLWTSVLRVDPRSPIAYLNRSQAYIDAGELDKAMADLDRGRELDPNIPKIYLNRGVIHFMKGEFDAAMKEFDRSIEVSPRFALGFFNRALTWGRLGQFGNAVKDLTAAIEIDRTFASAYYYRGLAYKKLDLPTQALTDFKTAYRLSQMEAARKEIETLAGR
jgi:tetratricopeptide (TPR) repeat protein